jgi:hypothetical protein
VYKYNKFLFSSSDSEIIGYALDTLYNIISNDEEEEVGKFPVFYCFFFTKLSCANFADIKLILFYKFIHKIFSSF